VAYLFLPSRSCGGFEYGGAREFTSKVHKVRSVCISDWEQIYIDIYQHGILMAGWFRVAVRECRTVSYFVILISSKIRPCLGLDGGWSLKSALPIFLVSQFNIAAIGQF